MKTNPVFVVKKFYPDTDQWKELGIWPTLQGAVDYLEEIFDDIVELLDQEGVGGISTDMLMEYWHSTHKIIQR